MRKKQIIGISGLIGSGKDTAANYLVNKHHFVKMSFAGSLKDVLSSTFNWDRDMLEGITKESREWRESVDTWWSNRLKIPNFTPRYAMQHIGTNVMRNYFSDEIWIASLENKILKEKRSIVITDCRFENEFNSIKKMGGILARVQRGIEPKWISVIKSDFNEFKKLYPDIHPSEYSSVNLDYDYYINNNMGLEDLYGQIRVMLR